MSKISWSILMYWPTGRRKSTGTFLKITLEHYWYPRNFENLCFWRDSLHWVKASSFTRFHNRQTSIPPAGFEPTISVGEGPQTYALDRAPTGTGWTFEYATGIITTALG